MSFHYYKEVDMLLSEPALLDVLKIEIQLAILLQCIQMVVYVYQSYMLLAMIQMDMNLQVSDGLQCTRYSSKVLLGVRFQKRLLQLPGLIQIVVSRWRQYY